MLSIPKYREAFRVPLWLPIPPRSNVHLMSARTVQECLFTTLLITQPLIVFYVVAPHGSFEPNTAGRSRSVLNRIVLAAKSGIPNGTSGNIHSAKASGRLRTCKPYFLWHISFQNCAVITISVRWHNIIYIISQIKGSFVIGCFPADFLFFLPSKYSFIDLDQLANPHHSHASATELKTCPVLTHLIFGYLYINHFVLHGYDFLLM